MPTLTPTERAAITAERNKEVNKQNALTQSAADQTAIIANLQVIDGAYKKFFDYYNDDIVGKYDAERKSITGIFVASPIVEADIVNAAANPSTGRLAPTPPATDLVRIAEFDGGGTTTTSVNELQHLSDELVPEGRITVGFGGTSPMINVTTLTNSSLTSSSTTLNIQDSAGTATFAIGNRFVIYDTVNVLSTVVEVTSVTDTTPDPGGVCSIMTYTDQATCVANSGIWTPNPPTPPYSYALGIIVIVPFVGTIASGSNLDATFTTFTNAERTTKTPTVPAYQTIMNFLVSTLQVPLNARLARLAEQISAIQTNQDPYALVALASALAADQANQTFLTNYLVTTDISDTGINSVIADRTARVATTTARAAAIVSAYTTETENFYNARYSKANDRGNTSRGTLREVSNASTVQSTMTAMAASLGDQIASFNNILL